MNNFSGNGDLSLEQFPLMELPREVRDMIYEACLAFDSAIFVRDGIGKRSRTSYFEPQRVQISDRRMSSIELSATAKARNLFYVSKQIRDEAVAIFYRKNTFEFTVTEMERFIRRMRVRNRHNLRSVIVYYKDRCALEYEGPLRALERCVGLRDLTLVLCCGCRLSPYSGGRPDSTVLQVPQAFEFLLRIRGLDNVRLIMTRFAWSKSPWIADRTFENQSALEAAVQVLKQPRKVPQRTNRNVVKKRAQKKKRRNSPST